ncbi:PilW family protein [Vibrio sp. YIC-376]|uniref:PilW family protein n=1 Tax=Vibrio sp. YIC-376 TaxID=3136162 RepID=UPI00402AB2E2
MKSRGFTLIEMVVTVVIGSIIMLGIASYIQLGMKGYADTIDRQRIQTQAQFVLEKMTREIRHAVPNSFHVPVGASSCLEFVPIEFSGFYTLTGDYLEFLLGKDSSRSEIPQNRRMVINPSRYEDLSASSLQSLDVSGITKSEGRFVVSGAASSIGGTSISSRHYIFQDNSAVRYCFDSNQVTRNGITVAENIDTSASRMHYLEPTLQRGGLVHINLAFLQDGERSVYQQDVQVLNVP